MHLNFKRLSENGPALVMMHGLFGSLENLGGIARYLAEDFSVFSLDMRNHGRSPHANSMSLQAMAADVLAFLDEQGLDRAHLLGHSLGGKVMMEAALTKPERVASVIVGDIAPVDYGIPRHDDVFAGLEGLDLASLTSRGQADAAMAGYIQEPAVRSFILKNLYRDEQGSYHWRINVPALKANYRSLIGANRDDRQYLGPVLFIKGELSDYIDTVHREGVVSRFPNAEIKVLAGTGHWLHAEKPELFAKLCRSFILR